MPLSERVTLAEVQAEIARVEQESKRELKYLRALARVLEAEVTADDDKDD